DGRLSHQACQSCGTGRNVPALVSRRGAFAYRRRMTDSARRRYSLKDYLNPRVRLMLVLGFSSGLPFMLVGNTFAFWLRDEGSSLKAIGFISWVSLAYSFQFVWAPL